MGDTFDATKSYKRIRFREDRDLLDTELNELQEIAIYERRQLLDRVYAHGTILEGLLATGLGATLVMTDGVIYVDGHAVQVPGAVLTCGGTGIQTVWVNVFRREVTLADDPSLVNPLTGEPTAEREKWIATLQTRDTSGDPLPQGATGRSVVAIITYDPTQGTITRLHPRPLTEDDAAELDQQATRLATQTAALTALESQVMGQGQAITVLDAHVSTHIGAGGTTHPPVTSTHAGFMTPADKAKLEGVVAALPAGIIMPYAGALVPAGWCECNGAAVNRTDYAALFAAIGTAYGAGDGIATFNVPDLRGEFVRGWDHGRGIDNGRVLGSPQSDTVVSHTHPIIGNTSGGDNPWGGH